MKLRNSFLIQKLLSGANLFPFYYYYYYYFRMLSSHQNLKKQKYVLPTSNQQ